MKPNITNKGKIMFNKRQRALNEFEYYDRIATREDLRDIFRDAVKNAFRRGYQKGYRTGRNLK